MKSLEAKELEKVIKGKRVVRSVSLAVQSNEIVGLLGPNGAGKTTVFGMIVGLVRPDRGTIVYNGEEITDLPMYKRARKGIAYLPQEPSVFRRLSVEDNLLAILETLNLSTQECQQRLENVLAELSIGHIRTQKAFTLSGGERRRVEIGRALVMNPDFLLLDEPFAGIDPIAVNQLQATIVQLKYQGIGLLITDHNVQETLSITDRAYILNEGEVVESGTPTDIVNSPTARAVYLGDRFRFTG
ncbi:MAG TPA: LPS export ABC transporter ATP-binding protein [Nitrospirales bacterium]|nr:LPS export ABC transporter ATP-binding protein [Nitrospirales bacterium]HIC04247.1 LPS export ABC transporter ATP-binding protein [Nitrospirales bacterium]